jgi:dTDP-4-amino-4,6-dideoxygalactose transaminase
MKFIPYGKQYIDNEDVKVVSKVLKSDLITSGHQVNKFEEKIKKFLNAKFSFTCNSGTSALFLALQSIGLKKNDIVIMPAINFIASYNVAKLFNSKIFLADVDKYSGQMSPENIIDICKKFKIKKIKAVITMYNGGYPDNAEKFKSLKKKYKCYIVEDSCHALGATYKYNKKDIKIGSCFHSDISTFSLHPLKTITTGEGGIVTTNSKKIGEKIKKLRSLGIEKNKMYHWKYDVENIGFNFRLNDFQCALGISQLSKISKFISFRKKIFKNYQNLLRNLKDINLPKHRNNYQSSHHLFIITLKKQSHTIKDNLIKHMLKNKIFLQYHYIPVYKFKVFNGKFINKNSEIYYKSALSLPIYYGLTYEKQKYIVKKMKRFFEKK